MGDVFSQLSKGAEVTSGLKKVIKGEKIDRPIPVPKAKAAPAAPVAAKTAAPVKPPKFALNGKKWEIEHQVKNNAIEVTDTEVKQTLYIYKCTDSVVQVKGKVNHITLDSCKKVALVFDSVVAGVDCVNSTSCKIQVTGSVQTISVDKCDGTQIILNKESLAAEVISAKSSELNIIVPAEKEGEDYTEHAIAEQFVSKFNGKSWVTESMAHEG